MKKFLIGVLFFTSTFLSLHSEEVLPKDISLIDEAYDRETGIYDYLFYNSKKAFVFSLESSEAIPDEAFYEWMRSQKILRYREALNFFPYLSEHKGMYRRKNI